MPMTLREIARVLNAEHLLFEEDPRGESTSKAEQERVLRAQHAQRVKFERRRAFEVRR